MKRLILSSLLLTLLGLLSSAGTQAQGFGYHDVAWKFSPGGTFPASGATITVCPATSSGVPCAPVASIFSDKALTVPIVSLTADAKGNFNFYAAVGDYIYTVTGTSVTAYGPIPFSLNGGAGGTINPGTQYAPTYYPTSATIGSIPGAPPTANGSYLCGYNISGSVASAPSCDQVSLSSRAVTGATATDTVLYTDNNSGVFYEGSISVAVSLPTPTTLTNSGFFTALDNRTTGVSTTVTVTPVTFTINGGATLVIAQNQRCLIQVDPAIATNWLTSCTAIIGNGTVTNIATTSPITGGPITTTGTI